MATIAITATSFCRNQALIEHARQELRSHTLKFADPTTPLTGDRLLAFLEQVDGLLVGRERLTEQMLTALATKLKAISVYGVGYDNIEHSACERLGISFYVAAGVNAAAVAEHTIGLMLAACRNIALTDRLLREGQWYKNGGSTLSGKTVAIIGCGAVGSQVANLLRSFGCRLLLVDIVPKTELATKLNATEVNLQRALQEADIITAHVPLTPQTRRMFTRREFAAMGSQALFVNTSRGEVVDEEDLKKSLSSRELGAAALDVFAVEPIVDKELASLPSLVMTPHIAGNAVEAVEAMGKAAVRFLKGHFG